MVYHHCLAFLKGVLAVHLLLGAFRDSQIYHHHGRIALGLGYVFYSSEVRALVDALGLCPDVVSLKRSEYMILQIETSRTPLRIKWGGSIVMLSTQRKFLN